MTDLRRGVCCELLALVLCSAAFAAQDATIGAQTVRVRLTSGQKDLTMRTREETAAGQGKQAVRLPVGTYTLRAANSTPARQRFQLFAKTFTPAEAEQARAYVAEWKAQGYDAEIVTFGKRLKTDSGASVDNRSLWVSIAKLDTMDKANALKKKLEGQSVWAWIVTERTHPGQGSIALRDNHGKSYGPVAAPAALRSKQPIEIRGLDFGFWKPQRANRSYAGDLEIAIGPDGLIEVYVTLPIEDYLAGVLPAEMPAEWPLEALKAQAVAARSEVIASMAGKHMLEGFDFCGTEHCRAYLGCGGRAKSTDAAVHETARVVLTHEGYIVPTVFCACCGGWTEDNETVWSAPPNPVLRGVPDFPSGKNPAPKGPGNEGMASWVKKTPPAFCRDSGHFRWKKRFTAKELTDLVNKKYPVGRIRSIVTGDRGASGRLKWVKVVGEKKTETIRKELSIRLAFGGLDSAMFIVEEEGSPGRPAAFVFIGGGRGHGVGLCQDGARAMALAGTKCNAILNHYFGRADVVRLD